MAMLLGERFELSDQVGSGGFGTVYRGRDLFDGHSVAVKVLHSRRAVDEGRFEREIALLSKLRHPSIVRYIAHGTRAAGTPYLVMEWLEGHTLAATLRKGRLSLGDMVTVALRIVDGLAAASAKGVIHRDVKPGNIFLPGGRMADTKLLDFGLAREMQEADTLTRSGVVLGTPLYMSPEQARGGRALDVSSDVFSLGGVLFECLCGVAPFEGDTALATLGKICFEQPARIHGLRANVPERLARLVEAMLHKEPASRPSYATIGSELRHLQQSAADEGFVDSSASNAPETHELLISEPRRESLRPRAQQRVLSAVFVGNTGKYSSRELPQMLGGLLDRYGARCEPMLDGSVTLLLERHPTAHEQAIAAAHCAIALRELLPNSPVVMCTARAVLEAGIPVGTLLENGARMLDATPQGVIRLDEASAGLLEARFDLRGGEGKRFLERERVGGEAPRTVLGRVTPFVGRERELGHVELLFRECVEDEVTRAVLVTAPAGVGKSRLRFELVQRLRRDNPELTLLTGAGDAARAGAPFSTLAPALRGLAGINRADSPATKRDKLTERIAAVVPDEHVPRIASFLGEMLGLAFVAAPGSELQVARNDPQLLSDRMRASWLEWLEAECRTRPVVILIDDLHWSDQPSIQFLEASLRSQSQRSLLLVALARPEVRVRFPHLWAERELVEIRLSKLGQRACEKVLAAFSEAEVACEHRPWLIERADGNPFFLEELIRSVRAGGQRDVLPDSVLATIQTRLDALGEDAKLLLRIASVFGEVFRLEGVEALLGTQVRRFDLRGWLKILVERELVFSRPGESSEFAFRHALVRDAAYALLTQEERELAHRLAGDWLEVQGVSEPAALAEHFERGKELGRAAEAYAKATILAYEANAFGDVANLGERASECGVEGALLGEVCSLVAEAVSYVGEQATAMAWAVRSKALLRPGDPGWWRARQVLATGLLITGGSNETIEAIVGEMLAHTGLEHATSEQLGALNIVLRNAMASNRMVPEGLVIALRRAKTSNVSPRVQGNIEGAQLTAAAREGNWSEVLRCGSAALASFRRAGALHDLGWMLNDLGYWYIVVGAHAEAEALLMEGLSSSHATAADRGVYRQNLGLMALRRGDWSSANELLRESVACLAGRTFELSQSLAHLAEVDLALGRLDEADGFCEQAHAADVGPYALAVWALVKLARGQHCAALELSARAASTVEGPVPSDHLVFILGARIQCLLAAGRFEEADRELREVHAWICERVTTIDDPVVRKTYLTVVPENAKVLELARTRLGLAPPSD